MKENEVKSLYVPELEHDSCGIGFTAHLKGQKSHGIVRDALQMLENMEHRGACGCDAESGDGAGILIQVPDAFFRAVLGEKGIELPAFGSYGVGTIFFSKQEATREECRALLNKYLDDLGLELIAYRVVPTNPKPVGPTALKVEPWIEQIFVKPKTALDAETLERKLFILKNYASHMIQKTVQAKEDDFFYIASFSHRIIVYKGQLRTGQVGAYYLDLRDERLTSALAMVHSRFSTNTFPKWKLAQPFRYMAHNGEINTIRGNVNWMKSKEVLFESSNFTKEELMMLAPICDAADSDSANLDNIVEMLTLSGRSLPHVMMMLIPEAWQEHPEMDPQKRAFYEYHASLMEPWDGPASVCFTDGEMVGATLDRNGLRPSRYCLTSDDVLVMASEAGALPVDPAKVVSKGRLQPGRMFVADLKAGRIISDEELKRDICSREPYQQWLDENKVRLEELTPAEVATEQFDGQDLFKQQLVFGFTAEDLKQILHPMATGAKEPVGSMGADTPLAVLSDQSQHLSHYFKQMFAQVSNPPIDSIRERLVMSLQASIGPSKNILAASPEHCRQIALQQPVLSNEQLNTLKYIDHPHFRTYVLKTLFPATDEPGVLEAAVDRICEEAEAAVNEGYNILILSDRGSDVENAPIPSLMAAGAVHHHLIEKRLRTQTGLVVEAGDVRETHHFATLIGYGVGAVNPYLTLDTIESFEQDGLFPEALDATQAKKNYIYAVGAGLLKIFSKMGISTLQSYKGAQIFEALGVNKTVIDKCFRGTISRIEGMGFDELAKEVLMRHRMAYPPAHLAPQPRTRLEVGGLYQWKRTGEFHLFNPETIHLLQHSTRSNKYDIYKKYARAINEQVEKACTLRGLLEFKADRTSIPIDEVEPAENIYKRFATGAMSFGSISHEAHSTLAIAMNRIGGKSNSGEGGEDEIRFERKANGDWERSAIKQVASGRFGVTSNYLTNAAELQIKMAQGAKPGEGGQLPGHKVDEWIGRVRHSTPGVGLISPPPHHDIYSIEDLAQLIYDLKNANREARINVKLVSEAGVGTIAAGVSKAHADVILISGHDGGTGASPLSSIRHAGIPWEIGLSEAHQTLVKNDLRSRVTLQTDGQIRTGRDIAIAIMLGAEEFGVATAALVVEGCIMMRKCHLNTCPVGVATQDPELRKLFTGDPDHVVNLFQFLVQDLREIMAELGFRTVDEMVGQVQCLKMRDNIDHWKIKNLDLSPILAKESAGSEVGIYKQMEQDHGIEYVLDRRLIEAAQPALENMEAVYSEFEIINTDRSTGTMLSNEISKRYGSGGLPSGTIHLKFRGSAGQSFAAFSAPGIHFEVEGEANDYFGKGLSGSRLVIYPDRTSQFKASEQIIIGNVAFYGATSGEAYIRGQAGERFCVRNSGVKAVVEGVGDHGCEYMTGGRVVVLGETGRNFAAGMSGGVAYIYDPHENFPSQCNKELVELEALEEEDKELVRELVENHAMYTESALAQGLLENWEKEIGSFIKVMPREYKAVLQRRRQQQEEVLKKVEASWENQGDSWSSNGNSLQPKNRMKGLTTIKKSI
ncbi:glutamate synthase (NADPH/NADH) large chain [Catalinimonas alkaloidigena]|uniref:Glutamate synthase [NADPH] large chain n=1 Tax=Catalinimonas alkaloidigena TaxID=1075417 RepID=A0A1G9ANK2_9BACT|nr:glutamate synthase large subunit [Catalinimonas alkaloidigena]SDK28813.1 glutamate synthase (NADPH/NADH) large chain [Catalinimonas alkaloidigena]